MTQSMRSNVKERGPAPAAIPVRKRATRLPASNDTAAAGETNSLRLLALLQEIGRLQRVVLDSALSDFGITRVQSELLIHLANSSSREATQSQLAERLSVGKVAIGDTIDLLEAKGLVVRVVHPSDRRAKRVRLTAAGMAAVPVIRAAVARHGERLLKYVSNAELAVAEEVLRRAKKGMVELRDALRTG